jgi:hypothetical protein
MPIELNALLMGEPMLLRSDLERSRREHNGHYSVEVRAIEVIIGDIYPP